MENGRILIVEDQAEQRLLAAGGNAALTDVRANPVDLRDERFKTPVLVLSGRSADAGAVAARAAGADALVHKPFDRDELPARVRELLERARPHAR